MSWASREGWFGSHRGKHSGSPQWSKTLWQPKQRILVWLKSWWDLMWHNPSHQALECLGLLFYLDHLNSSFKCVNTCQVNEVVAWASGHVDLENLEEAKELGNKHFLVRLRLLVLISTVWIESVHSYIACIPSMKPYLLQELPVISADRRSFVEKKTAYDALQEMQN